MDEIDKPELLIEVDIAADNREIGAVDRFTAMMASNASAGGLFRIRTKNVKERKGGEGNGCQ